MCTARVRSQLTTMLTRLETANVIDMASKRRRGSGSRRNGAVSPRTDIDMLALGRRLKRAREEAGFDIVTKLEVDAGVSRGTISRIENGEKPEVSLQVVAKIARVLGVRLDWLVFGRRLRTAA